MTLFPSRFTARRVATAYGRGLGRACAPPLATLAAFAGLGLAALGLAGLSSPAMGQGVPAWASLQGKYIAADRMTEDDQGRLERMVRFAAPELRPYISDYKLSYSFERDTEIQGILFEQGSAMPVVLPVYDDATPEDVMTFGSSWIEGRFTDAKAVAAIPLSWSVITPAEGDPQRDAVTPYGRLWVPQSGSDLREFDDVPPLSALLCVRESGEMVLVEEPDPEAEIPSATLAKENACSGLVEIGPRIIEPGGERGIHASHYLTTTPRPYTVLAAWDAGPRRFYAFLYFPDPRTLLDVQAVLLNSEPFKADLAEAAGLTDPDALSLDWALQTGASTVSGLYDSADGRYASQLGEGGGLLSSVLIIR